MIKITLVACNNKLPDWITTGINEFSKRLREFVQLTIIDIPLIKRNKPSDLTRILDKECQSMVRAIPESALLIALTIEGKAFSSEQMATQITTLINTNTHLCFIIGGPEGLHPDIIKRAHSQWSLSKLTLPHAFARLILLEALYRSWTININHPYHK